MKKIVHIPGVLLLLFTLCVPFSAHAVSYPILEEHRAIRNKAVFNVGSTIYLFQSGTPDVRQAIGVNDVLIVYRESASGEMREVGKIKVLSFIGEVYIKGEVIAGKIRHDDVAKKGNVSCLVILLDKEPK